MTLPDYSDSLLRLPWNHQSTSMTTASSASQTNATKFTAVIYSQQQQTVSPLVPASTSGALLHLLRVVSRSQHVARVNISHSVFMSTGANGILERISPF